MIAREARRQLAHSAALLALLASPLGCSGTAADGSGIGEADDAIGTTYKVGPTRTYKTLGAVASLLAPGDIVEVDGNATYAGGIKLSAAGSASQKITIRGLRVNGKRPVLSGGTSTIEMAGNHYVLEGFDVTGGSSRCIFHHADDITIRDTVVHDCPGHGILGADSDSGSLTMDYVEVYASGAGTTKHPVYIATDESAYPGSVFRMQHSYVHDGIGGNNVKTRAERNEIYYNWIEGGLYKELELIGPDGQDPDLAREDSDVVGNVFRKTKTQFVVRVGGDGTGDTQGRYRFVNNTFLLAQGSSAAIHVFDGIESIEMHNNVFHRVGGGSVTVLKDEGMWSTGSPVVGGSHNLVPQGTSAPSQWSATIFQNDPGFVDVANRNVHLTAQSPLVNAGSAVTSSPAGHAFPAPLAVPLYLPPPAGIEPVLGGLARPVVGAVDIGAFEYGVGQPQPPPDPDPDPDPVPPPTGACESAAPGIWKNTAFPAKTGSFTASWDVTPSSASVDGAVALAFGPQTIWNGLAAIVRFNPGGLIDVRKGDLYAAATAVHYSAGATYHVRAVVDVTSKKYSVYVTAPGSSEVVLAQGYGFRTQQLGVASLNDWVVNQSGTSGTLTACNFTVQ